MATDTGVIRIKPFHYIHLVDNNANVTRVVTGPCTYTRQEHEKVVLGPEPMITIPPRHYAVISNPIVRVGDSLEPVLENGNAKLRHGDEEIRFETEPFPLYPGEKLLGKVQPLQIVAPNAALRLRCIRDYEDGGKKINAGDEWLFPGPGTYKPRIEVAVAEVLKATIIKKNQALRIRARKACVDNLGAQRQAGEEWLVRQEGAYLPGVDEEIVEQVNGHVLTRKKALHLRCRERTFTDVYGKRREAGSEWLVTFEDSEVHIPDVYEEVVNGDVKLTTLTNRQYCVVLDPLKNGKPQYGQKEVRKGEKSFFLNPGERLEGSGIQNVHILAEEEALLLRAKELYNDGAETHSPGDRWMVKGPRDYVPPIEVEIIEKRKMIPLDSNEGIYVRDTKTGRVFSVTGKSYMLKPTEELWQKDLPPVVEQLLAKERQDGQERDKSRVVTYRAPQNSAVQIYDFKAKKSRIVWGPGFVMLEPDEHFTVQSLSGDKPKRPHVIKSIALLLGPDFMTDIVTVETSDHARLSLKLSYNWQFEVDKTKESEASQVFQVPDFVGDACKAIASRVRGAVAAASFDNFHKNSAKIIRAAVFGVEVVGEGDKRREKIKNYFKFTANNLVITNIDIQSVEPVDQRTRDSLQKSVQLAIEITTKSQEADARHEAEKQEQDAKGRLERQKIQDEAEAEKARRELLSLQAESATVESTGQSTAEAKARAQAQEIEGKSQVELAKLNARAKKISNEVDLTTQKSKHEAEIAHKTALMNVDLDKARELASVEAKKFHDIVGAIGPKTIQAIAQAGPELQARLLSGLGLKSFMITDGNSPINLFNMAKGLVENSQ